jgi:hypothetical protein
MSIRYIVGGLPKPVDIEGEKYSTRRPRTTTSGAWKYMDSAFPCRKLQQLLILHLIGAYAPKKQRIFVAPDVVDTILGREGPTHESFVIFEEFEKKLFGENWTLSKDRFISIDIGPIVGLLVTRSRLPQISPEVIEKVTEYLVATLGPWVVFKALRCRELSYAIFMATSFLSPCNI